MEESLTKNEFFTMFPCYIKEELDISNLSDGEDMSLSIVDSIDKLDDIDKKPEIEHLSITAVNENSSIIVTSENVSISKNSNNKYSNNIKMNGHKFSEENSDSEIDVENDSSSDTEACNENSLKIKNTNVKDHLSSDEDDFELKVSDDSGDKVTNDETSNSQVNIDKSVLEKDSDQIISHDNSVSTEDDSNVITKTYITRNRSKGNNISANQSTQSNSFKSSEDSKTSNSQINGDSNITNINENIKNTSENTQESISHRVSRRNSTKNIKNISKEPDDEKKKYINRYCIKCDTSRDLIHLKAIVKCPTCLKNMKFKCLICNEKICDTYCGIYKHIRVHHPQLTQDSQSSKHQQKVKLNNEVIPVETFDKPDLDFSDIKKFSVLNCLGCNSTCRVQNNEMLMCDVCELKMVLTCLICSKWDGTANGMYKHLHEAHQEHFAGDSKIVKQETTHSNVSHKSESASILKKAVNRKKCLRCGKKFQFRKSAWVHMKVCGKEPHIECKYCNFKTKYSWSMKHHLNNKHGKKSIREAIKNKSNNKAPNIEQFNTTSSKEDTKCPICFKLFENHKKMKNHKKYCGIEPNLKCEYCSYKTKFATNLKSHKATNHHDLIENMVTSPINNVKVNYVKEKSMPLNIGNVDNTSANNTPFLMLPNKSSSLNMAKMYCSECKDLTSAVMSQKVRHCDKCNVPLVYKCIKCQKEYDRCQSMLYHLQSKCDPQTYFHCCKCDYKTSVSGSMQKHLRIHGITKSVNFTPKRSKGILNDTDNNDVLQTSASTEKSPQKRIIKKEVETNKIKPNLKKKCDKCNAVVQNMTKHLKYCGKGKYWKCNLCSYESKYDFNFKKHLQQKHFYSKIQIKNKFNMNIKVEDVKEKSFQNSDDEKSIGPNKQQVSNTEKKMYKIVKGTDSTHTQITAEALMEVYCSKCDKSKPVIKYASKCRGCDSNLTFRCGKCSEEHPSRELLRIHVRQHWNRTFACAKCSKAFMVEDNWRAHEKVCKGAVGTEAGPGNSKPETRRRSVPAQPAEQ